jgi:hypothetical protein
MLYELTENALATLDSQWTTLSHALSRFGHLVEQQTKGKDSPIRDEILGPDPTKPPLAHSSLVQAVAKLSDDVNAEKKGVRNWTPMSLLVSHFNTVFRLQQTQRRDLEARFLNLFLQPPDSDEFQACKVLLQRIGEFIDSSVEAMESAASEEANRVNLGGLRGAVEGIASYPLLTSEVNLAPSSPPGGYDGSRGGMLSIRRQVDGAVQEVLGRLPRTSDPRSFVVALKQSFEITETEGHTDFRWTPRTYAGQTELGGGVTGAQASLYTRAQVALDKSLPLLDGLYPLLPDADEQLTQAARAIVRSELTSLVSELGMEGGPRFVRVDGLFDLLLKKDIPEDGITIKGGHIGYLTEKYGLKDSLINTLEEESNFSNFIIFQDYVSSLQDSWTRFKDVFKDKDLGTNLVLLSRALSVTAEAVAEVHAAMDSVFVGPAERQVAAFPDGSDHSILVDDLLSWVLTFASDEAPSLVREGGKRGISAIVPTAQQLADLVRGFLDAIPTDPLLPEGLRHPRVVHPLQELRSYLERVHDLASSIG